MNKYFVALLLSFVLSFYSSSSIYAQGENPARCASYRHEGSPNPINDESWSSGIQGRAVMQVPVVVHVVWNSVEENISDEQIYSQIEVLNNDFRAENMEIPQIPSIFQSLVADVEIEFCLAQMDPEGNETNGITRTFTQNGVGIGGSSNIHYTAQGGRDAWDTDKYLNIWVAKFAGGIGGIASFPGDEPAEEQGVEINYRQFGTMNTDPPYHLGRTCTHEIGHYFNLEHPWGPGFNDCCEDDFVDDTPEACATYLGECPTFPISSCSEPDMFMNYMFYTNDECMGMFTLGQKARMLATLNTTRSGLLLGEACNFVPVQKSERTTELEIFGNPVRGEIWFQVSSLSQENLDFKLFDVLGKTLFAGNLQPNTIHTVDLENPAAGIYFLKVCESENCLVKPLLIQ